jgi:5-methylcytosine-specific restriction endonuclease McrA
MYQILIILSLFIVFKLCDWIIDEVREWKVKRDILSDPILRYEYYKGSYSYRKMKKLKRMSHNDYFNTHHWELARSAALKRDENRCADCGISIEKKPLEVHHITYIRRGKEHLDDLMTLCQDCHQERHFVSTAFE